MYIHLLITYTLYTYIKRQLLTITSTAINCISTSTTTLETTSNVGTYLLTSTLYHHSNNYTVELSTHH